MLPDTTSVNTGKKTADVVVRLQKMFAKKRGMEPQFIGCQHYILDRILRVAMDEKLDVSTKSPNIEYPFVNEVINQHENLKMHFENGTEEICEKKAGATICDFYIILLKSLSSLMKENVCPW